ncbi:MAG: hypothetical protein H6742_21715 [Alphaproteobacteria bacterium]|nr:hypothetical protein [Alphaproteobacteria bacterium]
MDDTPPEHAPEIFVPPSREARRLQAVAPRLTGDPGDTGAVRHLRDALVAPFTQLTFLSFDLQAFLFEVFHTTFVSRAGHLLGMVGVNLFLMAGFSALTAGIDGIDGGAVYAGALLCWYAAVSRDAELPGWWWAMVPVVGGLYGLSQGYLALTADAAWWASPWIWMLASAFLISLSHAPEPRLPPRAGDPHRWVSVPDFVLGEDRDHPPTLAARRALRVAAYPFIGLVDELWASPRLLPYNVLFLMFAAGYAPARRQELHDRATRAMAHGQPAVDFVGTGGGALLPRDG